MEEATDMDMGAHTHSRRYNIVIKRPYQGTIPTNDTSETELDNVPAVQPGGASAIEIEKLSPSPTGSIRLRKESNRRHIRRPSSSASIGSYDGRDNREDKAPVAYWMPPHASVLEETLGGEALLLEPDDDEPVQIDFRCACYKLTNISTVNFTTDVKFVVVFEWNDPRLCGMLITTNDLPGDLWGPDIMLENAQNDCEVVYDSFSLLDSFTGRLKRTITFHGPVYNPMNLRDFPFDNDELEFKFVSMCNWRTLDGSRFGNDPVKRTYKLEPMLDKKGTEFFFLGWGGKINEFSILGWSHDVQNPPIHEPNKPIIFQFDIHMTREAQFYYFKILVPLWLLVLTSLFAFAIETDDLQGRLEILVTLLLSTIAFLYIIQESIPKMSSLTVIDKVVLTSLVSLVMAVFFSYLIAKLPYPETLNWVLATVNQLIYWITNIALVGPPHYRYKKYIAEMEERQATKLLTRSGNLKPGMIISKSQQEENEFTQSMLKNAIKQSKMTKSFSLTTKTNLQGDHETHNNQMLGFKRLSAKPASNVVRKHAEDSMQKTTNVTWGDTGGLSTLSTGSNDENRLGSSNKIIKHT